MKKYITISVALTFFWQLGFSQSSNEINALLSATCTTRNSKDIIKSISAKKIIRYGNKILPVLANYFRDTTVTDVISDCQGRTLNKGEVAMILADRVEMMPYSNLTGIQNCTLTFCGGNPNFIEFYLWAIKRNGVELFFRNYSAWLTSNNRKKWITDLKNENSK